MLWRTVHSIRTTAAVELNPEQRQAPSGWRGRAPCPFSLWNGRGSCCWLQAAWRTSRSSMTPGKTARWRQRFLAGGVAALERDAPRSSRTRTISERKVNRVVVITLLRQGCESHALVDAHHGAGGWRQRSQRETHLACPWTEAVSVADFQSQPRFPDPGEAGGHHRPVSESARARHRALRRRKEPDSGSGPHPARVADDIIVNLHDALH